MKYLFTIIFLITGLRLSAQVQPLQQKADSAVRKIQRFDLARNVKIDTTTPPQIDTFRHVLDKRAKYQPEAIQHRLDSINQAINDHDKNGTKVIDSANAKIDQNIKMLAQPGRQATQKIDSSEQKLNAIQANGTNGIDSVVLKISNKQKKYNDSLNVVINKYQSELQLTKLQTKIDSLKSVGLPYQKYAGKLDSLQKLNSFATAKLAEPMEKMEKVQSNIQHVSDAPIKKINEKIGVVSKEANGQGNLPETLNSPMLSPAKLGVDKNIIPQAPALPKTDFNVQQSIPVLPGSDNNSSAQILNKNVSSVSPKGGNITSELNKIDALSSETAQLSKVEGDLSKYSGEIKTIQTTNVERTIETTALSSSQINGQLDLLKKQQQEREALEKKIKGTAEYKKQTLARGRMLVAQQMALHTKEVQAVVNKVSSYQKRMGTVFEATSNLPKKRDSWRRLKSFEKFVPGVTLQLQKPGAAWLVDINPTLRYRLTTYWSVGGGWNERLLFGKYSLPYDQTRVFGARAFTEVVIFKGFSFRLDVEDMNIFITPMQQSQDAGKRIWVWNYMTGIKKDFPFMSRVTGNVQFMYNAYSSNSITPYPTRLNVRFGFELQPKRKSKNK